VDEVHPQLSKNGHPVDEVHPQLSKNGHPVDDILVGAGSSWLCFLLGLLDDKYILVYKYEQQICATSLM